MSNRYLGSKLRLYITTHGSLHGPESTSYGIEPAYRIKSGPEVELVLVLRLSPDADVNLEELAAITGRGGKLVRLLVLGRRDEEFGADKLRACDVPRREGDLPDDLSFRGDAKHLAATVDGSPDASFLIHGKPIGNTGAIIEMEMNSPVADFAGLGVEVEREDLPRRRVRHVHGIVLRVPPYAIGDGHLGEHTVHLEIRVQSEQDAFVRGLLNLRVVHGPSPESSARVNCPIVEAHPVGSVSLRNAQLLSHSDYSVKLTRFAIPLFLARAILLIPDLADIGELSCIQVDSCEPMFSANNNFVIVGITTLFDVGSNPASWISGFPRQACHYRRVSEKGEASLILPDGDIRIDALE